MLVDLKQVFGLPGRTLEDIWKKNRLLEHYLGSIDNPELIIYRIDPNRVRYMKEWALNYYEVEIWSGAHNGKRRWGKAKDKDQEYKFYKHMYNQV